MAVYRGSAARNPSRQSVAQNTLLNTVSRFGSKRPVAPRRFDEADLLDVLERFASIRDAPREQPHRVGVQLDQALADRRVPVLSIGGEEPAALRALGPGRSCERAFTLGARGCIGVAGRAPGC